MAASVAIRQMIDACKLALARTLEHAVDAEAPRHLAEEVGEISRTIREWVAMSTTDVSAAAVRDLHRGLARQRLSSGVIPGPAALSARLAETRSAIRAQKERTRDQLRTLLGRQLDQIGRSLAQALDRELNAIDLESSARMVIGEIWEREAELIAAGPPLTVDQGPVAAERRPVARPKPQPRKPEPGLDRETAGAAPGMDENAARTVKLQVRTGKRSREVLEFTDLLRKIPQLRILRLAGSAANEEIEVWIALKEPVPLGSVLRDLRVVSDVEEQAGGVFRVILGAGRLGT